jgi:hypothetical protein
LLSHLSAAEQPYHFNPKAYPKEEKKENQIQAAGLPPQGDVGFNKRASNNDPLHQKAPRNHKQFNVQAQRGVKQRASSDRTG